jgi:hypothetical protein
MANSSKDRQIRIIFKWAKSSGKTWLSKREEEEDTLVYSGEYLGG